MAYALSSGDTDWGAILRHRDEAIGDATALAASQAEKVEPHCPGDAVEHCILVAGDHQFHAPVLGPARGLRIATLKSKTAWALTTAYAV
jgi:hypothetical protein